MRLEKLQSLHTIFCVSATLAIVAYCILLSDLIQGKQLDHFYESNYFDVVAFGIFLALVVVALALFAAAVFCSSFFIFPAAPVSQLV